MDVTSEIRNNNLIYSASDNTDPNTYASSKAFNYAEGLSIHKPAETNISVVPFTLNYEDSVGLFGAENHFIKVSVEIDGNIVLLEYLDPGYVSGLIDFNNTDTSPSYSTGIVDSGAAENDNNYDSAKTPPLTLPIIGTEAYFSVKLINNKTGNIYVDSHVDARLYTKEREEHPYDLMYITPKDFFYIGVHARNTKRLPYNISCEVGKEYLPLAAINDKSYIMRTSNNTSY